MFAKWGWQARAIQPKSRSLDRKGILWEVQAVTKPDFEVFHLAHSDVLVSQVEKGAKTASGPAMDIQASAKTIAALTRQNKAISDTSSESTDPLQINDPWASSKMQRIQAALSTADQIDAIADQVKAKLNETSSRDHDMEDADEQRIHALETRLNQLEHQVQTNHAQQTQHNAQVSTQMQQIQQQFDTQSQQLKHHFDSSLSEQLRQIETMLAKRSKTAE